MYSGHDGSNNYHTKLGLDQNTRRKNDYAFPLDDDP